MRIREPITTTEPCGRNTGDMHDKLAIAVVISSWLAAVAILWAGSYPSGAFLVGLIAGGLVAITAALGLIHIIAGLIGRRVWAVVVATGMAVLLIGGAAFASRIELPLLARFALVRPAFDRVVAERAAAPLGDEPCPSWIGTYRIGSCRTIGSAMYFRERDGGFLDAVGFAYLPDGPPDDPPTEHSIIYGQLRGPWYWYNETW